MALDKLILILIHLSGGVIKGKTLLQKKIYFLSVLLNKNFGYRAHYYGPYSPLVEDELGKVKSLSFVEEKPFGYGILDQTGFEVLRHDFILSEDGQKIVEKFIKNNPDEYKELNQVLERLNDAGDTNDYITLSIAAKIHYILTKSNISMSISEIRNKAEDLGWNITNEQFKKANTILKKLDLIEDDQ